jgi:hypothetical protein
MSTAPPAGQPSGSDGNSNNGGGGGGGDNGLSNGGTSLASSASLYRTSYSPQSTTYVIVLPRQNSQQSSLTARPFNEIAVYTFLATLVLLLSVSAAIVVRSFLLRRRHRRMIEEAIRNGTWVPPISSAGRGAGPRVDLTKRPRMWEVYLDLNQQQQQHMPMVMSDERDWESMKPIMATYINDQSAARKAQPNPAGGAGAGSAGGTGRGGGQDDTNGGDRISSSGQIFQRFTHGLRRVIGPYSSNNGTGNNTRQGSSTNLPGGQNDPVPMTEVGVPTTSPSKVRVAVLIAMPRPNNSSSTTASSSTSPSTSTSRSASTPPSSGSQILLTAAATTATTNNNNNNPTTSDEEEELPHIEMGVADLVVANHSLSTSMDGGGVANHNGHHNTKGKIRESMMSVGSV